MSIREQLYSVTSDYLFTAIEQASNGSRQSLDELLGIGVVQEKGHWLVPAEWGYLALINDACGPQANLSPKQGLFSGEKRRLKTLNEIGIIGKSILMGGLLMPYCGGPELLFDLSKYSSGIPKAYYLLNFIGAGYGLGVNAMMEPVFIHEWKRLNQAREGVINDLVSVCKEYDKGTDLPGMWASIKEYKDDMRLVLSQDRLGNDKPLTGVIRRNAFFSNVGATQTSLETVINSATLVNKGFGPPYIDSILVGFAAAYSLIKSVWNSSGARYFHKKSKSLQEKIKLMSDNEAMWELYGFLERFKYREQTGRVLGVIGGLIANIILPVATIISNPETLFDLGVYGRLTLGVINTLLLPLILYKRTKREQEGIKRLYHLKEVIEFV